jgi:hypothetical protein
VGQVAFGWSSTPKALLYPPAHKVPPVAHEPKVEQSGPTSKGITSTRITALQLDVGEMRDFAVSADHKSQRLAPLGGVAVPADGETEGPTGAAFCSPPLPKRERAGLPVNIKGALERTTSHTALLRGGPLKGGCDVRAEWGEKALRAPHCTLLRRGARRSALQPGPSDDRLRAPCPRAARTEANGQELVAWVCVCEAITPQEVIFATRKMYPKCTLFPPRGRTVRLLPICFFASREHKFPSLVSRGSQRE